EVDPAARGGGPGRAIAAANQRRASTERAVLTENNPANVATVLAVLADAYRPVSPQALLVPRPPGRLPVPGLTVCQLYFPTDLAPNVKAARELLARAADAGAALAVLPEYTDYLGPRGQAPPPEPVDGPYAAGFADAAREHRMWVAAGSFHETGPVGRTYNTALVFDRGGALAATYRKIHLYDVDIPGRVSFHESRSIAPGDTPVVVDVEGVR